MVVYSIINMSDALTLKSDNFKIAAVAIALLGGGNYGLETESDEGSMTPILMGWDDFFKENGIDNLENYIKENKLEIAEVLQSVMLGKIIDRPMLDIEMANIAENKLEAWIIDRNDKLRSSMNNIELTAHTYAAALKRQQDVD